MNQINFSPIVRAMVINVIRHESCKNISSKNKHTINTDLIPAVNSQTIRQSGNLQESSFVPPKQEPQIVYSQRPRQNVPIQYAPKIHQSHYSSIPEGYGKLTNLLRDPYVTYIECFGPDTPLMVIKNNQRQKTKLFMNKEEIKSFFNYVSEKTKIPITEGVFKVLIDNNLFNAIISEVVGTKFIIKKNIQLEQVEQ